MNLSSVALRPYPPSLFHGASFKFDGGVLGMKEHITVPQFATSATWTGKDGATATAALDADRGARLTGALNVMVDAQHKPAPPLTSDALSLTVDANYYGIPVKGTFFANDPNPEVGEAFNEVMSLRDFLRPTN